MNGLPLHPAIVHLPLGIAVIVPLVAIVLLWAMASDRLPWSAWLVVVGLQATVVFGAALALYSGEADEHQAESRVGKPLVHAHEQKAKTFLALSGGTLLLAAAAAFFARRPGSKRLATGLMATTIASSAGVLGLGVMVGHSGGAIVYGTDAVRAEPTPDGRGGIPKSGSAARKSRQGDEHRTPREPRNRID